MCNPTGMNVDGTLKNNKSPEYFTNDHSDVIFDRSLDPTVITLGPEERIYPELTPTEKELLQISTDRSIIYDNYEILYPEEVPIEFYELEPEVQKEITEKYLTERFFNAVKKIYNTVFYQQTPGSLILDNNLIDNNKSDVIHPEIISVPIPPDPDDYIVIILVLPNGEVIKIILRRPDVSPEDLEIVTVRY
jgi:hypothetical protein